MKRYWEKMMAFIAGDPPPDAAAAEEVATTLTGSKKQQQPLSPAPCRILTARDLQPGSLSPNSSVSSSSPAAAASKRAKSDAAPNTTTSTGTVASGLWPPRHPQSGGMTAYENYQDESSLFNQANKKNASEVGIKKAVDESAKKPSISLCSSSNPYSDPL